jgi:hypothetical protein
MSCAQAAMLRAKLPDVAVSISSEVVPRRVGFRQPVEDGHALQGHSRLQVREHLLDRAAHLLDRLLAEAPPESVGEAVHGTTLVANADRVARGDDAGRVVGLAKTLTTPGDPSVAVDADQLGVTNMKGASVRQGQLLGDAGGELKVRGLDGRIETTTGPWKRPAGWTSMEVRHMGHAPAQLEVAEADARLEKPALGGEAAAEQERDQVGAPEVADVGNLGRHVALAVDAVAGEVGPKIRLRRDAARVRVAEVCHRSLVASSFAVWRSSVLLTAQSPHH